MSAWLWLKICPALAEGYLEVGLYTEIRFPEMGVRFIAVIDGVDSKDQRSNDFITFRNIIRRTDLIYC